MTALHYSAARGHLPVVKILIEKGANLDATNPQGITALSATCFAGQMAIAQCLLDAGADGGIADKLGFTPT